MGGGYYPPNVLCQNRRAGRNQPGSKARRISGGLPGAAHAFIDLYHSALHDGAIGVRTATRTGDDPEFFTDRSGGSRVAHIRSASPPDRDRRGCAGGQAFFVGPRHGLVDESTRW